MKVCVTRNVLLLLSLVAVMAPGGRGSAQSQALPNYADLWRMYGEVGREAYIDGVVDGNLEAFLAMSEAWLPAGEAFRKPESDRVRLVRERLFLGYQRPQVGNVMTTLYGDPSNAYIPLLQLAFIARDKLAGKSIEASLQAARKRALDDHRMREQIKR